MALVDSGATISVIHPEVFERVTQGREGALLGDRSQIQLADGGPLETLGTSRLSIQIGDSELPIEHEMVVAAVEAPAVVGLDFMRAHGCVLDMPNNRLVLDGREFCGSPVHDMPVVYRIKMAETVVVPPESEMILPGAVEGDLHFTQGLVEGNGATLCEGNVAIARALVNPTQECLPVRVVNLGTKPQTLYKGTRVATCEPVGLPAQLPVTEDLELPMEESALGEASFEEDVELPEHLQSLLDSDVGTMSQDEQRIAVSLILGFEDRFSRSKRDFSTTDVCQHSMNMKSPENVKLGPRRLPLAKLKALKEELLRLLELEVIEPSSSSWASPVVLVTKKDGSIRLCIDFRKVNNLTIKDSYPLPRMDDSIDALSGSKWFSTLDLSSGYWQVKMDPKDIEKTAFATPFGLYQFKVMPFGLANAPATFERLMERVLAGLHWETCLIYIDDIIVFSKTFDEHVDRLTQVLQRLRAANLKLASHKCKLFRSRVEFLGHVVSDRGVETDPKKIEAISAWPEPKTVKEVRSFIGLSSYYRRFVKDFAKLARPLHRLTEKDTSFEWTTECQEAFNSLKAALASPPILGYPLVDGLFTLDTDASLDGIGAVLSQEQDGVEKVIAYYSRALTHTERKYCVTRRELLAVVESVKHFHHYLYGRHFVIRTDHGSLRWLLNFKNPEDQMARWLEDLFVLDFEIQHRPGRQHGNADGLSRRPCTECRYCERQEVKNREPPQGCPGHRLCSVTKSDTPQEEGTWLQSWTPEQLAEWQQNDIDLKKVHMWMEAGQKPPWKDIRDQGSFLRTYWSAFEQLKLEDDVIYHSKPGGQHLDNRLIAPEKLREILFKCIHSTRTGGHLGIKRTLSSTRQRFWWPGMKKDITRWCQYCDTCQRYNRRPGRSRTGLRQDPVGSPMERIAFDILSFPEETEKSNRCVLVVSDYFTKWSEAFALPDHQAETVAEELVTKIFLRFGAPRFIHSDQAPEFMSDLMRGLFRLLEINRTRTCPYRPQSDGLVERMNRTLIDMLSKFCGENADDWDEHIPYLMCAYRATINESTKCSPNLLMLGREITLPIDLMYPSISNHQYHCHVEYVEWVRRTMQQNFEKARENLKQAAERQKRYYDQRASERGFQVGDHVLRFYPPNLRNKLNPPYIGPYTITKKLGEVTYKLEPQSKGKAVVVHTDHLKLYRSALPVSINPPAARLDFEGASDTTEQGVGEQSDAESQESVESEGEASAVQEDELSGVDANDTTPPTASPSELVAAELGRGRRVRNPPGKFHDFLMY